MIALRTYARKKGVTPSTLLLAMAKGEVEDCEKVFQPRALAAFLGFGKLLAAWRAQAADQPPLEVMDHVLTDVEYRMYIDDGTDEGSDRWDNVMELRRLAAEYKDRSLSDFLEDIALVSDQDTLQSEANVPTLLTLHAAKGLEFGSVFIVGLNDGTLPHARSFDDPDSMEEERRLLYVGITRAKDRLYLSFAQNRSLYGYAEPSEPSRFLNDIPEGLWEESTGRSGRGMREATRRVDTWQSAARERASAQTRQAVQYPPGTHVMHPVWGEGMVLNSRIQDDDEVVDIFFESLGMKRVAASLARLEVKR
jgi:DNA helicase-2/ATP-dependent DNA helicase PcrA